MTNEGTRKDLQLSRAGDYSRCEGTERGHSQDFTGVLSKKSKREMTKTSIGSQLRLANAPNLLPALSHRCHSLWSQRRAFRHCFQTPVLEMRNLRLREGEISSRSNSWSLSKPLPVFFHKTMIGSLGFLLSSQSISF